MCDILEDSSTDLERKVDEMNWGKAVVGVDDKVPELVKMLKPGLEKLDIEETDTKLKVEPGYLDEAISGETNLEDEDDEKDCDRSDDEVDGTKYWLIVDDVLDEE